MYISTYMVGQLRNVMQNVVTCTLPRAIGIGDMCITQFDTFRYAQLVVDHDGDGGHGTFFFLLSAV